VSRVLAVIAIDGPAASGKSSTGALVARRLGWAHLDSGALYRALTLAALDAEEGRRRTAKDGERWSAQRIVALAEDLPVRLVLVGDTFRPEVAGVDVEEAIRTDRVTRHVSAVAAIPEVRTWVNARQRAAVASHPTGVVVDGRDIGTVVFPDAPLKVFLTATPDERAGGVSRSAAGPSSPTKSSGKAKRWPPGTRPTPRGPWPPSNPPPMPCYSTRPRSRWSSRSSRSLNWRGAGSPTRFRGLPGVWPESTSNSQPNRCPECS